MNTKLFEVEIVKEGERFIARIMIPEGDVITIESESLEEVLDNLSSELQDKYGVL